MIRLICFADRPLDLAQLRVDLIGPGAHARNVPVGLVGPFKEMCRHQLLAGFRVLFRLSVQRIGHRDARRFLTPIVPRAPAPPADQIVPSPSPLEVTLPFGKAGPLCRDTAHRSRLTMLEVVKKVHQTATHQEGIATVQLDHAAFDLLQDIVDQPCVA